MQTAVVEKKFKKSHEFGQPCSYPKISRASKSTSLLAQDKLECLLVTTINLTQYFGTNPTSHQDHGKGSSKASLKSMTKMSASLAPECNDLKEQVLHQPASS